MIPSVTLLYAGLCGLLVTLLGMYVSAQRSKHKAATGQLPEAIIRPVRAHGNATEWIPTGLLLLLLLELSHIGNVSLHVLGGGFLLGRLIHAFGMLNKSPIGVVGAGINYLLMLVMSVWAVCQHFRV
jgi:uncharacterized membrane protein YecN with MAPEG domain